MFAGRVGPNPRPLFWERGLGGDARTHTHTRTHAHTHARTHTHTRTHARGAGTRGWRTIVVLFGGWGFFVSLCFGFVRGW